MPKDNETLEDILSRLLFMQSALEYEACALESLIKVAYSYAEGKDADLRYLLDTLKNKADKIKNIVQTAPEK